jgi:serine/threonine protein kinase
LCFSHFGIRDVTRQQSNNKQPNNCIRSMIPFEVGDYVGESKIGTGSFAEVWKGYHKITKQPVAIKVVDLERLSRSNNNNESKLKQHLNSEMKIMKSLDHKNIVKMFEIEVYIS